MSLKDAHDKLLAKDLTRHSEGLIALYAITGLLAILVGPLISEEHSHWLVGAGGFLLGMGSEKFATRQIRRVAQQLAQEHQEKHQ
jgi:hypothetical protein